MKMTVEDMIAELEKKQKDSGNTASAGDETDNHNGNNNADASNDDDTTLDEEDLYQENFLDIASMSKQERRTYKKELFQKRLATMSFSEKIIYTVGYYKWYFFSFLLLIFLIAFSVRAVYRASLPTELYLAILNDNYNQTATDYITEKYRDYNNLGDKNFIKIYNDLSFESTDKLDQIGTTMNAYQQIGYYNMYDMLDVIIGDEEALKVYLWADDTTGIDLAMDEELYNQIKDHVIHMADPNGEKNDGKPFDVAIDISDTNFVKNCHLSYDKVYLFIPSTKHKDNESTLRFIKTVFELE